MYHNIEKHPTDRSRYIGYANGPWRIVKCFGQWRATKLDSWEGFGASTLREISVGLSNYEATGNLPAPRSGHPMRLSRPLATRGAYFPGA